MCRDHNESILKFVEQNKYKNNVTTTLCNTHVVSTMHVSVAELLMLSDGLNGEAFIYSSQRYDWFCYNTTC